MGNGASRLANKAEDWITLGLSVLLLGGLFLDGYAHTFVIDTATEDFFTPWHAVFYAAFAGLAAWIGFVGYKRRRPGPMLDWFPSSYQPALLGLLIFAVGGIGDGIWHTIFGVEVGIDALLSPTHLLLLAGGLVLAWTPVRSSASRGDESPILAVGAVLVITAALVFFIQYWWFIPYPEFAQQPFDAATGNGTGTVQLFFGGAFTATAVLVGPLLLIAKRWRLPFGAATVVWTVAATLEALAFSRQFWAIIVVAVGGLVFDLCLVLVRSSRARLLVAATAGPAALFSAYLIYATIDGPIGWPPEIWGGLSAFTGFIGLGLALLQTEPTQRHEPVRSLLGNRT